MKLSTEQLERLSERIFKVLKTSGHISLDVEMDERIEERVVDTILSVLEEDSRTEDRLSREAERLVQQQSHIAKSSGKTMEELVDEVKNRLERADTLAEKILRALWKLDGVDFFSEDFKIQNCMARAVYRFRMEDDKIIETVEKIVNKKTTDEPYSSAWCQLFDKYANEVKQRLALKLQQDASSLPSSSLSMSKEG
jgi:hypothetical protein